MEISSKIPPSFLRQVIPAKKSVSKTSTDKTTNLLFAWKYSWFFFVCAADQERSSIWQPVRRIQTRDFWKDLQVYQWHQTQRERGEKTRIRCHEKSVYVERVTYSLSLQVIKKQLKKTKTDRKKKEKLEFLLKRLVRSPDTSIFLSLVSLFAKK